MACVENACTYFDDLEEGEIREEIDPSFVSVPWNQEPVVTQDVTTAMKVAPSKETIVREKLRLEFRGKNRCQNRDKKAAKSQQFHKERESSAEDPKENPLTRLVKKVRCKRSGDLLSQQETIVREKAFLEFGGRRRLEVHEKAAKLQRFPEERESSEADHIKDQAKYAKQISLTRQAKDPKENSLTTQVIEICSKRSRELLSLQDLERKQFNLSANELEREFKDFSGKLSTQNFEILDSKFRKHMKSQNRKLIALLIKARNRERKLKELWLMKASEGTLEESFCEIPLPCSRFKMDSFDYRAEMEVLGKNGNCTSGDMHLDAIEDEGSSGSEILLEAQVASDHIIAEVSQCSDNAINATRIDPKVIPKSPSASMPNSNFESDEMNQERNEMGCNATVPGVPETCEENFNSNSPQVIIHNPNLQSDEGTLQEQEQACTNTTSIGLVERNIQNPILNSSSSPGTVHSDQIVASDTTSHSSTRSQEPQMNPAINLPYTSNMTSITDLRLRTEGHVGADTPLANQNAARCEQSATQSLAPDGDIGTHLLQMMHHNINNDPLQNELTSLIKLKKALTEKHNEKVARVRAEYERELDNTRRKYQRMEVEADAQLSGHRARLNMAYQKLCKQRRLAEEFRQMFYLPSVTGELPIYGQEQFPRSSHPQFTSNSLVRPSTSNGFIPNPLTIPEVNQSRATLPAAPSFRQRPVLPVQSPQYLLNQQALRNSFQARAPIGGTGPMGFYPGVPPFNHMRHTPLSMPRAHIAMSNFGNI